MEEEPGVKSHDLWNKMSLISSFLEVRGVGS